MTNTLRSIAALLVAPAILACTLLSACAPTTNHVRDVLKGPTLLGAAINEVGCAEVAEPESDAYWECFEARETARCQAEGWCGDEPTLAIVAETQNETTTIALAGDHWRCGVILDGMTLRSAGCE